MKSLIEQSRLTKQYNVLLRRPHPDQQAVIASPAKRKVIRAGRRSGKTVGVAIMAVLAFLDGKRVLYGAPTVEQIDTFWREVKLSLAEPLAAEVWRKNETEHYIELSGTEQRLKAKTVFNADTMRGDYAGLLILDEWQLCDETAWTDVGAPMLLDMDGDAIFIYTPPSLRAGGVSRARDPLHAAKLYQRAQEDTTGRWETFHWTSRDNPYISGTALADLTEDMSREAYRREIDAEDDEANPARLIYRAFDETVGIISPFSVPVEWPRYVGHDFGSANPAALFFAADPATGYLYAYQEYLPGAGRSTFQHVEEIKRLTEGTRVVKRVGGSHQEDEIRQGYTAQGWPISEPRIRDVKARIDRVKAIMERGHLFIFRSMVHTIGELRTYVWKVDSDGMITDDIHNKSAYHEMDCMAYILSDFTPETVRRTGQAVMVPSRW